MQQQTIVMRHSFRIELLFSLEVGFLDNDILSFYRYEYKALSKMLTTTKTNINIINNNSNSNSKTAHSGLQIDVHENIDGQNNSVGKELMNSTLTMKRIWYPV